MVLGHRLPELGERTLAVGATQPVEQQLAEEMIGLVLEYAAQELITRVFDIVAIEILACRSGERRAGKLPPMLGYRQASLLEHPLA